MSTGVRMAAITLALAALGCASSPQRTRPIADDRPLNTDACAMRLHDMCGPLLVYFARHRRLPAQLEKLRKVEDISITEEFACPVSHLPYVYNPDGLPAPDPASRLIVYDAAPSHGGRRWAISIVVPHGDDPLVAKVIAVPESFFAQQHPTP